MPHKTEIVRQEPVSNDCIAVTIRCCGDSRTDETMTIFAAHRLTRGELAAHIEKHHNDVAEKHRGMMGAQDHLRNLTNRIKSHE